MNKLGLLSRWARVAPMLFLLLGLPAASFAGRPLVVEDAAPVDPGLVELDLGIYFEQHANHRHYDIPCGLTYGLAPTLEVGLGFGGQMEEREEQLGGRFTESGLGDLLLGAKWNLLQEDRFGAGQALAFVAKLPTANHHKELGSGEPDFDLTYILSKTLSERWNAHLNAGYTLTGNPEGLPLDDNFHGGVALGFRAIANLEWVAEVYAGLPVSDEDRTAVSMNGGLRWTISDAVVLDAAIGAGLCGDAPDWTATLGLTWSFGRRRQAAPQ